MSKFNFYYMFTCFSSRFITSLLFLIVGYSTVHAQRGTLFGTIFIENEPAISATIQIKSLKMGTITDIHGHYSLENIPTGEHVLSVSLVGAISHEQKVQLNENEKIELTIRLKEDVLNLEQVVVTGTRSAVTAYESPVMVSNIGKVLFESTQSLSLAEGLHFSPGLRVENNCQNCGFTQLRMNGLDGAYSQILINSRPVFSALAGVYGLEMIPATMVDRIEVVRGGGSVLYGGNAIAGTVNIITKDPVKNSVEVGFYQGFLNFESPDRTLHVNGSIVSSDFNKGLTFYAFNRARDQWDFNNDDFSDITLQENSTFGFDGFWNPDQESKVKVNAFSIKEFRRGGNGFDLAPHQTDLTEQLRHVILGGSASYERYLFNQSHKLGLYSSFQTVQRDSYYGGGGRILTLGKTLLDSDLAAINAYGNSNDISLANGFQYSIQAGDRHSFILGSELQYNDVLDAMPGYNRSIEQQVAILGNYLQWQWKPISPVTILMGGRYDVIDINGTYTLSDELFTNEQHRGVFVPRVSLLYDLTDYLSYRVSFAQGYRAPQAFNEDLHIETVGGAARFIQLSEDLKMEHSDSYSTSLNLFCYSGVFQATFVLEGFYTRLYNPFILADQTELESGVSVITKRNGSGAEVSGINLEANWALGSAIVVQSGATFQSANFIEVEILWEAPDEVDKRSPTTTKNMLRTPNTYGYFSILWKPLDQISLSYSGVYTGSMSVAHVIDPVTEFTEIKQTPHFFEQNVKMEYEFRISNGYKLTTFAGIQNITNSFQRDLDIGPNRDAGYVFGPSRPRTIYSGLKIGF